MDLTDIVKNRKGLNHDKRQNRTLKTVVQRQRTSIKNKLCTTLNAER